MHANSLLSASLLFSIDININYLHLLEAEQNLKRKGVSGYKQFENRQACRVCLDVSTSHYI